MVDDGTPMNVASDNGLNGQPIENVLGAEASETTMDMSNRDAPDALPKIHIRPAIHVRSPQLQPSQSDTNESQKICPSVEAWSATDYYNLSYPSMGKFVIINNRKFDSRTGMGERNGTDLDAQNLYLKFKELGFDVGVHHNQTAKQMQQVFQDHAKADHSRSAAFGCAILTHGEDGVVYGTDRQLEIDHITKPFRGDRCKSLVGKPKFFFIQACRGSDLMDGIPVDSNVHDASNDVCERLPVESDFLIAYSVVPGFFSWRNSLRGSWFVQAICACLDKYGKSMDMVRLLTRVNKQVALDFESNTSNRDMHQKKQIPCITSMLTKDFYLDPKAIHDGLP